MSAVKYRIGGRRTYRKSTKKLRLIGVFAIAAVLLVGLVQTVAAIKVSIERAIKTEALKDG